MITLGVACVLVFTAALLGAGVCYAALTARAAALEALEASAGVEDNGSTLAQHEARQNALDKRLHACERAVDELCLRTSLGAKRERG